MSPLSRPARRLLRAARGSSVLTLAFLIGSIAPAGPATAATAATVRADISAFAKLGAWVDVYDYGLDAWKVSGVMKSKGVRTIYLQTGRWNSPSEANTAQFTNKSKVDWWIHSAHARGMKIVGWYLPAYNDMARDVRRSVMVWTYRTGKKQHFDGVGIDIEYKGKMPTQSAWNNAVATHLQKVRAQLGVRAPIASITPAPLGMAVAPKHWAGFPWKAIAAQSNVMMPMGYWSYRKDCASNASHCPYGYTKGNVTETRRLTGNSSIPVHAVGGVADGIDVQGVKDFVRAARDTRAYGGSLYDYRTTTAPMWGPLSPLNT